MCQFHSKIVIVRPIHLIVMNFHYIDEKKVISNFTSIELILYRPCSELNQNSYSDYLYLLLIVEKLLPAVLPLTIFLVVFPSYFKQSVRINTIVK